jgi:acetylornithine deacetylase/succinyl-diaminopimelate desuccinylase-like protein
MWILAFLSCVTAGIAEVRFQLIDRSVVLSRLHACPKNDLDRQEQLRAYFVEVGCTGQALFIDRAKHYKFGNVICTLQGTSPEKVIVGAHFDHADVGSGAVDNWSGTSFLPSLYQALAASPRKHTFVFVGFYGEELGMLGSQQYVRNLRKEELASIDAMVNLDTFVLGPHRFGPAMPILPWKRMQSRLLPP